MANEKTPEKVKGGAAGRVVFIDGRGELPMLEISTAWSTAEIYLHGAHVTDFKKKDEPPLLFLSQCSRFAQNEPILGPNQGKITGMPPRIGSFCANSMHWSRQ